EGAEPAPCTPIGGADPLYILYTSGTTGQPKGVVRPSGGHMVALIWTMENIYGVGPGEVMFTASDVGWVVGHSYIVYAPLLVGATTIMFEGKPIGTPDAGVFWRVISEHGAKVFFTAPTASRAVRRQDPDGAFIKSTPMPSFERLYFAGERADPPTVEWAGNQLGVPVIDHWWQTETGFSIAANPMGLEPLPIKSGSPTVPMPGYDLQILDEEGEEVPRGQLGAIAIKLPLPPGTLPTLWGNDARFSKSYLQRFEGYYETGDAGYLDEDGYVYIMARTDDVINVAGHRLSTGAMEEVLAGHPDVAECAVIGVADELKGQVPLGFLCLSAGCERSHDEIVAECVKRVRDEIGPVAFFKTAIVVDRLPKTRSGKILRGIMARIADGQTYKMPATIDDPAILEEVTDALGTLGYGKVTDG
ncbi:MAG: AMP-binding protein, partial [Pseudomonadota bacterium]